VVSLQLKAKLDEAVFLLQEIQPAANTHFGKGGQEKDSR
jgi:hypothetical protein